jgi:hypothetical protein
MNSTDSKDKGTHVEGVTYTVLTDGFSVYDEPRNIPLRLQVVSQGACVTLNESRVGQDSEICEGVKERRSGREKE